MSEEAKICVSCKHHRKSQSPMDGSPHICIKGASELADIVSGEVFYMNYFICKNSRLYGDCGPEGKFFSPKELS